MISAPIIRTTNDVTTASIRLLVPGDRMPEYMDPAIQELYSTVGAQGIAPAGPLFSYHHRRPSDTFDFEIGIPVASPIAPTGRVANSTIPECTVATAVYTGPYEGLSGAWRAMEAWVTEQGLRSSSKFWESYLTNPEEVTDPNAYQTELNWVLDM